MTMTTGRSTDNPLAFWRSPSEHDGPDELMRQANAWPALAQMEPLLGRREFLRLLGASLAMAGMTACSGPPPERIVPEVGRGGGRAATSARYATALSLRGDVVGIVVQLRDGRPIRVDGNPRHPASLGGSDAPMQAAILDLWDPARSRAPRQRGVPSSWAEFEGAAATLREDVGPRGGGMHIVSGPLDSPTLRRQRDAWQSRYPDARWYVLDPAGGRRGDTIPDLSRAEVIVTLDADLLGTLPGHLVHARRFAARRVEADATCRLYAIEPTPSLTGRNAEHPWPVAAKDMPRIAEALAAALGVLPTMPAGLDEASERRVAAIARDLRAHASAAMVVAGPYLPEAVHALAAAMNRMLGSTLVSAAPAESTERPEDDPGGLVHAMRQGRVDTLVALDANPAYALPGFTDALRGVRRSIHLGRYRDETAEASQWHLPLLHPLETWSDLRARDGTVSIVQPVLAPLVDGRSVHDVLDLLLGTSLSDARERVRQTWPHLADEAAWTTAVREGAFRAPGEPAPAVPPSSLPDASSARKTATHDGAGATAQAGSEALEIVFRPDEWLWDGRHADNAWLHELPRPVTSLTWGNAALLSPALAADRGLADGDVIRLEASGRRVELPVLIVPGQAVRTVTLVLGHGRRTGLGRGIGVDVGALRPDTRTWQLQGVTLTRLRRHEALASTQSQQDMQRRDVIRIGTPAHPARFDPPSPPPSLYPEPPAGEYRWGMTIDLAACIGCNACTAACQAENNIPVVGKDEVIRGRRMHWIRVDRYHKGATAAPLTYHQPVPCMHCEHAPCEVVCPVEATVHDSEGLNLQVYNRCIGTRFCSNNCPYKVRRFNFLQYADFASESLKAMRNPEVTVRSKGVMEKCTYCVQRIERAHIDADREGRRIVDGEARTACQVACPTQAIAFGDLGDPHSAVSLRNASARRYHLLEELNTRPRTSYLAALRQPDDGWEAP